MDDVPPAKRKPAFFFSFSRTKNLDHGRTKRPSTYLRTQVMFYLQGNDQEAGYLFSWPPFSFIPLFFLRYGLATYTVAVLSSCRLTHIYTVVFVLPPLVLERLWGRGRDVQVAHVFDDL